MEPFGRSVAFTAVSRLNWSLRGLGSLGGWGHLGRGHRGGQVLWVRWLLMLMDLLQRPLAASLLLPVCTTVDETRTVRHHKYLLILLFLFHTSWYYFFLSSTKRFKPSKSICDHWMFFCLQQMKVYHWTDKELKISTGTLEYILFLLNMNLLFWKSEQIKFNID